MTFQLPSRITQIYVEYAINDIHMTESEKLPLMDNVHRRPHERMIRKVRLRLSELNQSKEG